MSRYQFDAIEYPSVTTVLGYLDKPGLSQWSVGCVIRKSEELLREGMVDMMQLLSIAEKEPHRQKNQSMDLGNWAHTQLLEEYGSNTGVHTGMDDWIDREKSRKTIASPKKLPIIGWDRAKEAERWGKKVMSNLHQWSVDHVHRWIEMERPVVHEHLRYAGTPDFLLEDKEGRILLGDLKVSKQVYDTNKMQVSAYAAARNTMSGSYQGWNGKNKRHFEGTYPSMYIHRVGILLADRLTGDVTFHDMSDQQTRYFEAFRGLLHCYYHIKKRRLQTNNHPHP